MHPATTADWKLVDGTLRGFAITQCQLDSEIGRWILAAQRTKPWEKCGMRSIYEYVERMFPWGTQAISERLRTAKALEELPTLDAELSCGRLNFSVVREVTRVATPETVAEWIEAVRLMTARQVEEKVARHVKGERPKDPGDVSRVKKRITLTFSADQWAIVASALAVMRKHDATLTDEECFRLMSSAAVDAIKSESPDTPLPARPYRLQVEIGLDGTSFLKGVTEERHEISPALAECAQCDAEVWIRRPDGTVERVRTAIPQPMRRLLNEQSKGRCELCRIRIDPQLHHLWLVSEGGKHDIEQMIVLCPNHHDRVHEGSLWIHGSRSKGFTLTMADGSPYGSGAPSPKTVVNIEVFQGLRRLGFQEKEIRPVLEALRDRGLPTDALVREALKMLGRRKASPTWEAARETDAAPTSAPPSQETGASDHGASTATSEADTAKDAFEGLRGLGFTELEIRPVLVSLRARDLALADLLRESLKMLHRSRSAPTWEKPIAATPGRPRKYRLRPTESEGVAEREVAYRTRNRNSMNLLGDAPPTRRMRLRASGRRRGIAQSPGRSPTWERAMRYPADQSTRP